jgi:hypothetical protein
LSITETRECPVTMAPEPTGRNWLTTDAVGQNDTYVGQRLLFQRAGAVETDLVDMVSGVKARRIMRRAFGGALLIVIVTSLAGMFSGLGSGGGGFGESSSGGDSSVLPALGGLAAFIWLVVQLLFPLTEILSDWHLLLDRKAEIADTAYGVVFSSLRTDHEIPAIVEPRRTRVGPPVRGVRNLLRVRIGKYHIFISVFAFGRDLYLGWALYRRQIPLMIVLRWLASFFGGDPGYSGLLEMEPIKAMREAVHNALRRGVEAAIAGRQIPIAQSFGYEIPIENMDGLGSPGPAEVPAPRPPAPAMVAVVERVEVFTADGRSSMGFAGPGGTFEFLGEGSEGLVVRDHSGAVRVIKERSSVRPA